MKILYIGNNALSSTSQHRVSALSRLGHEVLVSDPYAAYAGQLNNRLL